MNVLEEIISGVRQDLDASRISRSQLMEMVEAAPSALDSLSPLRSHEVSVIAEVKRSSPSKGILAEISDPAALAMAYQEAGAAVVSVLTERRRFAGSLADLAAVRAKVSIPVLRKDFMIDEYQFYEARAYGADLVLLIVAALTQDQLEEFHFLTRDLGMRAIVEVHTQQELEIALNISPDLIGINSRNLKTLDVDRKTFADLLPKIPRKIVRIAESGISSRADVEFAKLHGADAVLVGEALVRGEDPSSSLRALLGQG